MVLIVGGEGSGKRSYAETLGYAPEQMADAALDARPVVSHVEKMGFPAAEQLAVTSFSNIFVQSNINRFGAACMAGWTSHT